MTSPLTGLQCIVALADNGSGYILDQSDECREKDVIPEYSTEDSGFNPSWDKGLTTGVYLCTIKPWACQDFEGEWDAGIDVTKVEPLWTIADKPPPSIASLKAENNLWNDIFYEMCKTGQFHTDGMSGHMTSSFHVGPSIMDRLDTIRLLRGDG
jgi:hypothetical protein